ncbi:Lipid phosphate phosphatase epsilon 2 [Abeliophyllum distichum]|uniref:Lipid phosphate phosphatase epsilon 2 n=1 Tax=Abeliophyllum distichum TaxID=126358 RepID=A0ABD1V5A6_9LAMI
MQVILARVIRPIAAPTSITYRSERFHSSNNFFGRELYFRGKFFSRKFAFWANETRNSNTIKDSMETHVSTSENGVQAFEQEAFIEGSLNSGAVGFEATLNSLSKWLVAVLFGAIVLWRHDAESLWALMGSVLNAILSISLKKILKHERPISTLRSDPGMPSSHAQSIFYTVAFVNLSMAEWYGINGLTTSLNGLVFILGCYFSWLRVSQQLHTVSQVVVGAVLGYAFSVLWFFSWRVFVLKAFITYLPVRIVVVLGAIGFGVGFIHHVFRTWLLEGK